MERPQKYLSSLWNFETTYENGKYLHGFELLTPQFREASKKATREKRQAFEKVRLQKEKAERERQAALEKAQQEDAERERQKELERIHVQEEQAERERQAALKQARIQKEKAERERLEALEKARKDELQKLAKKMEELLTTKATPSYKRLLANLSEMDVLAGQIDVDFTERAFAPFWDGICSFAVKTGRAEDELRLIAQCYQTYKELHEQYLQIAHAGDPVPPLFNPEMLNPIHPVTVKRVTDWFHAKVRKGQTDIDFALIYEHYQTRKVLVKGFGDLVKRFTNVSDALDSVNRNLIKGFRTLNACVGNLRESIEDEFAYLEDCIEEEQEATRYALESNELNEQERHEERLVAHRDEQEATRQTIRDEQGVTRQTLERSELLTAIRHEELVDVYEYQQKMNREALTDALEEREAGERQRHQERLVVDEATQEAIIRGFEQREAKEWERHEELVDAYADQQGLNREALAENLERSEAGEKRRHEKILVEGKHNRELLKEIDFQVGGKGWWKH